MGFVSKVFGASNDYNATGADNLGNTDYSAHVANALNNVNGVDNTQSNATAGMQTQLAQALMQQMQGNGPSVAQNQLTQTTNANNQAAAGQVGSIKGINPALAARMILQNNAANNQAAAGQGATLRAQEQLGAAGQLGGTLGTQRSQDLNQAQGTASTNANTLGTLGGLQNTQNANQISNALGTQQINSGVAGQNANTNGQVAGGIMSGIAGAMSGSAMSGKWKGGPVGYADGGEVASIPNLMGATNFLAAMYPNAGLGQGVGAMSKAAPMSGSGGPSGAMPSSPVGGTGGTMGEAGGMAGGAGEGAGAAGGGGIMSEAPMLAMMAANGGQVPGKPIVPRNNPINDTVETRLTPEEVVLPLSVTKAKNSPEKAKEFMEALKKEREPKDDEGYGRVLKSQRLLHERLAAVEKYCMGGKVANG
jgi:hypothetical protein